VFGGTLNLTQLQLLFNSHLSYELVKRQSLMNNRRTKIPRVSINNALYCSTTTWCFVW